MKQTANQRLKEIRFSENYSQEEFAKEIGVSLSGYQLIEQGKRDINTKILESLKNKFNVSADWLLFGKGDGSATNENSPEIYREMLQSSKNIWNILKPFTMGLDVLVTVMRQSEENHGDDALFKSKDYIQELKLYEKVVLIVNKLNKLEALFQNITLDNKTICDQKEDVVLMTEMCNALTLVIYPPIMPYLVKGMGVGVVEFWKDKNKDDFRNLELLDKYIK
ncbi:helix-turn-helix domain-containing protein [Labilibaculum euxinus]|uniref:Helix-turn-helix domain-containing protein n=1 Tax=Labilibaculum euxinus TaxID=2686357 RepID=A0A7M4DB58_9BACT|nr:helix-turn-helix transcriptional regulator [Labilibaculum euxinus]MUP39887.1 helix-turn-helix domain-containing protein [Labilibaculum euxinus]MVB09092.1 helix-turn-helix domain-containing protein [Labilibaculum euxinus]